MIVGGPNKVIQEDRDPTTNKLISVIPHELKENDELIAVN